MVIVLVLQLRTHRLEVQFLMVVHHFQTVMDLQHQWQVYQLPLQHPLLMFSIQLLVSIRVMHFIKALNVFFYQLNQFYIMTI